MSLIVTTGTPIPTVFEVASTLKAALPRPQIDIVTFPQESEAWCYAACASSVIEFCIPGTSAPQCEIAEFVKAPATCCPLSTADPVCTESGCDKEQISEIFDNFQILNTTVAFSISFNDVMTEIKANRLIEVVVDWDSVSGQQSSHAVLIAGFIEDWQKVFIIDPLDPPDYFGWHDYSYVDSGFGGHGAWADTWFDLQK